MAIRDEILTGNYKLKSTNPAYSKTVLPVKKEEPKKGNIFSAIKTIPTSIAEGFAGAIQTVDRFAEEKLLLPIKAGLSKKTYSELLEENRKNWEEKKDPLYEAKSVAEYAKQKYGENSKKYNKITSNLNQEKKVNPLNMKYTDTDTYKRKEAGELTSLEKSVYNVGSMAGGLLPTIGATMLTGNPLVGKAMFAAKAQQGYTEKALSEGKTETQANVYGTIMGAAELATEAIGFNPFKTTLSTGTRGVLKTLAKSAIGEGIEEGLIEYVDSTVRSVGFKEKFDFKETTKEAAIGFGYGALLGAIMEGSQMGISSAMKVSNKIKNNETPTPAEIETAVKDVEQSKPGIIKNKIDNGVNTFKNEIDKIQNLETQKNKINNEISNAVKNYENNPTENLSKINKLSEESANIRNEIDSLKNNDINLPINSTKKTDIINFSKQVDDVFSGKYPERDMLNLGQTPKILQDLGLKELPITMTQKHLKTIINETGPYKNVNYHGLGKDLVKQLPNAIANPLNVLKSSTKDDSIVVVTELADKQDRPVIASIKIDGKGTINNIRIDTNVMTSAYGRNDYDNFMKRNIDNGNLLYDVDEGIIKRVSRDRVQFPMRANSSDNNISQNDIIVNNYDMQRNKKNAVIKIPQDPTRESSYDFLPQQSNDKAKVLTEKPSTGTSVLEDYQRTQQTLKQKKDSFIQQTVNKGHYIDKMAKEVNNPEIKFKYDKMLGANAEGQYVIGNAQTNNEGKIIGKSINEIWKPVEDAGLVKDFSEYLLHKHNIDRAKQGKFIFGKGVSSEMSAKEVDNLEKQYPRFIEWSKDINTFNKNQLQNMREAGLASKETEEYLNATYDNYVRVKRNIENLPTDQKGKKTRVINPLKKAIGGNADILPLKDSMAEQVIKTKQAIRRNDLGLEMLKTFKNAELTQEYDFDNIVRQDKDGAAFTVFKDGEIYDLKISPELYQSLSTDLEMKIRETEKNLSLITKPVQKLSQVQRSLLTVDNPLFIATNFFKDIGDAPFNSKYPTKFFKNYAKAVSEYKNKGNYYQEYMGNGGESNSYFDYEKGVKKAPKGAMKFIEKIRSINEAVEQYPRIAEYISTREAGGSITEAMYNSAEVTTNFKRGGDITKAANRNGVNFLNASVQGLSKQYRNLTGVNGIKGYTNLLLKATMFGIAPSILNHLLLGDDEDYKDLSSTQKDLYYLFKTGDGKFVRIPKGRAISIFGATARRSLEGIDGDEDAFKGLGTHAFNQLAPNNPMQDNILAPITQAASNKTWYGGDLVPLRLQNELPKNQFDESTDAFSKFLGEKLNISPKKINYVLDQYSGGIGDVLLPLMTPQARNNPLSSKFTTDSVMSNKNVGKFFETSEEQQKIANDMNASETDILKSKYLNSVRAETNDLYKEKRQIQMSDLSNKEKKEKLREIQSEINAILEDGLNGYKDVEEYGSYARVADREYFKNSKNEWQRVEDDLLPDLDKYNFNKNDYFKNYSEITEIKSKYKKLKEQTNNQTKKNEYSVKQKQDLIDSLMKTNFTDEQKVYIYGKSYADADSVVKAKIPVDIYLQLQKNIVDIKSINDPNSNIAGKTISGSKKEQIVQQIQKLPTTRINKLMLYAMEGYGLTSREKTDIFNHVNSMRINTKEKQDIIKSMSNFQWLKNGQLKGW